MPIHILKKVEDKIRDYSSLLDYFLYLTFNPFKFKRFPREINAILIVELFKVGDLLVATPIIRAIQNKYPCAQIDVLVLPTTGDVLEGNKNINEVIRYNSFKSILYTLRKNKYDLGILLHPGSFKISLLLLLAGIRYRVGVSKTGISYGKGFFLNKKIKPHNRWKHKIEDNFDVVRSLGITPQDTQIDVVVTNAARKKIDSLLKSTQRTAKKAIVCIHAPSSHESQRWLPERFADLSDKLSEKYQCQIIFTGLEKEREYVNSIVAQIKNNDAVQNLAGRTNFGELAALLEKARLLITIDTSALHLASATKTPTIALFGPTIPYFWGPSYPRSTYIWKEKVVCVGCRRYSCIYNKNYECMRSITVNDVLQKVEELDTGLIQNRPHSKKE